MPAPVAICTRARARFARRLVSHALDRFGLAIPQACRIQRRQGREAGAEAARVLQADAKRLGPMDREHAARHRNRVGAVAE